MTKSLAIGAILLALCTAAPVHASGTAPLLAIRRVEAIRSSGGAAWIRVEGTFPDQDLVQLDYPLELVVRDANGAFVWFPMSRTPRQGTLAGTTLPPGRPLLDALAAAGANAGDAHVLQLGSGSLEVQVGRGLAGGEAEALLFVVYRGSPVFSNPFSFRIAEGAR